MQKISPFLWFDSQAEEASKFYASVFKDSEVTNVTKDAKGSVMWVSFKLEGVEFMAINGGPKFEFTEAISFFVNCDGQEEVDYLWNKLSAHPESEQCGWLKDKYGLSWQIIPKQLGELLAKDKSGKVMQAMLKMKKIEVSKLEKAHYGK